MDKLVAALSGKRCRKQYGRHAVSAKPREHTVKIDIHVGIVGMNFIDYDNLAGKAQVPKLHVARLKRRHKQLVDRAHNK